MLQDYKRYILSLRNNFIRCGVGIKIQEVDGYEDVFNLGERLSDLLWFYTVLGVSGSDDKLSNFLYPMDSFYMGRIRDKYFEDYLLYKAGYMQISAKEAILREKVANRVEKTDFEYSEDLVENVDNYEDYIIEDENSSEDDFIDYGSEAEFVNSDEVDDFSTWGVENEEYDEYEELNSDDDFVDYGSSSNDLEEDEFVEYGGGTEGSSESLEDDEFVSYDDWGSEDNQSNDVLEDDEFVSYDGWGSDEGDIPLESGNSDNDEDDDEFLNWGSDSENNGEDTDEEFSNWGEDEPEEEIQDESSFDEWGTNDQEIDEDTFEDWGSGDDTESFDSWDFDDSNNDEDIFSDWGDSDDSTDDSIDDFDSITDFDDVDFGNWGDTFEEDNFNIGSSIESEDSYRYPVSSERGGVENAKNLGGGKSKVAREMESNDKTAETISRIFSNVVSGGSVAGSKLSNIIKNKGGNSE